MGDYGRRLAALIPGWRKAWSQPDMPFLVGGLCHKGALQTAAGEASNQASVREFQRNVTDTLRGTWLSVLVDLGDAATWHYPQKPQAGKRLGMLARGAVHGQAGFAYESPRPTACFRRGAGIVIPWDTRGSSLQSAGASAPTGFQVAESDNRWTWATAATLKGDTVFLTTALANPTQVRHAWANRPVMNLGSAAGLPAAPFHLPIASEPPVSIHAAAKPVLEPASGSGGWPFRREASWKASLRDLRGRAVPFQAVPGVFFSGSSAAD